MFNNIVFEIFIYYLLNIKDDYKSTINGLKILNSLKLVSILCNNNIKNDIYYNRKKNAYMLCSIISKIDIEYNSIDEFIEDKFGFKYILTSIFNIYCKLDFTYAQYRKQIYSYKNDKLNPLKRLPLHRKNQIQKMIQESINLSMALHHAEKIYSVKLVREIEFDFDFLNYY